VLGFVKEIWIQMRIFRLMLIIITPKTRGNRSEILDENTRDEY
jgi:hypothetical protein